MELLALICFLGLLAVWVIYPLTIAGLAAWSARRRPALGLRDNETPSVSVIIATREDEAAIRSRIADCLNVEYDHAKLEIVVGIDPRGGIASPETLVVDDRVTVVRGDEPGGKATTLNAAVRVSRGDILVFTDTYQRFHLLAIRELVAAVQAPGVGGASGCVDLTMGKPRTLGHYYWTFETWLRRCEARFHSSVGAFGPNWALRRSLWSPLPPHLILDDLYEPMCVVLGGHRMAFAEQARATEMRQRTAKDEYRRKVRTLTGVVQLCLWLPAVLVPTRNPIWLQFIFHKIMRLLTPYFLLGVALWAAVAGFHWLLANIWLVVVLLATAAAWSYYARVNLAKLLWDGLVSGVMLQAAVIIATINGFRRRWDVWAKWVGQP